MTDATAAPPPFDGLYGFIKNHLIIVNNLIAASCFAVGALDFLAPKLWLLPRIVYSCTAALAAAMLFAALMPALAARIQARFFGPPPSNAPLWRRGGWQFAFALLCVVSVVGFASVAKASSGGLAASQFSAVRDLQAELLSIRSGVADANAKLDVLIDGQNDPRRALASRGYAVNSSGLMEAIKQGDRQAVGLFVDIKLRVERTGVTDILLLGPQEWDQRIADMLDPAMFKGPEGCVHPSTTALAKEPLAERIRTYARLCGKEPLAAYLSQRLADPLPANAYPRDIEARAKQRQIQEIVRAM